ncbi:transposase [Paenimyroides aestuarii]|uniref:Transposase n=2 Tax=Paenimyroides aestuarii TaxID=2968490 RepID=A0ABY5NW45_9FLAO|nr:transposase [Paenimyroides aestuarii]
MHKTHESTKTTQARYTQYLSHYQAGNCQGCPLRGICFKAKGNWSIERNNNLERHKEKVRNLLLNDREHQKQSKQPMVFLFVFL